MVDFFLDIDAYYQLLVCIWDKHDEMYEHTHYEEPYDGCYTGTPYRRNPTNNHQWIPRVVGEIHLVLDCIGAGCVAHELQHFILDWVTMWDKEVSAENEEICSLSGRLTSQFWDKFYEHYKGVEVKVSGRPDGAFIIELGEQEWEELRRDLDDARQRLKAVDELLFEDDKRDSMGVPYGQNP